MSVEEDCGWGGLLGFIESKGRRFEEKAASSRDSPIKPEPLALPLPLLLPLALPPPFKKVAINCDRESRYPR